MIQRLQTIFLAGVITCMIISLMFPLITIIEEESILNLSVFNLSDANGVISTNYQLSIPIVLVAIVAVISMLSYKNRLLQIKLGALISLLVGVSIVLIFFEKGDYKNVQLGIGIWALMASLICNFFSNWFIRRDEKLVRDSDRLR